MSRAPPPSYHLRKVESNKLFKGDCKRIKMVLTIKENFKKPGRPVNVDYPDYDKNQRIAKYDTFYVPKQYDRMKKEF